MNYYNPYLQPNPYTPVHDPRTTHPAQQNTTPIQQTQYNPGLQQCPNMIYGRSVNSADEITPQEVPMDGSVSLFPQQDYSCIYAKTWTKDGTIATVKFVPEQPQAAPQKSPIEERLDRIDQRFDRLEKMLSNRNKPKKPYNKPNQGKEEQNNA